MSLIINETVSCKEYFDTATSSSWKEYKCMECGTWLNMDDVVWTETNDPYCVGCCPEQEEDLYY